MKMTKKTKMLAAIGIVVFIAYNTVFWMINGFSDHEATFWISWVFMMIACLALVLTSTMLGSRGMLLRDFLFGYPIMRHSAIYIIAEFIASTLFVIFEESVSWQIAFCVQLILLAVYLVFAISCLLAKETIHDVHTHVSDKTRFIKLLRGEVEMLCEKCGDPGLKPKLVKLAEDVRCSDPMSSEALFELEKELTLTVSQCEQAISELRYADAEQLCGRAALLLTERNKKCKALK